MFRHLRMSATALAAAAVLGAGLTGVPVAAAAPQAPVTRVADLGDVSYDALFTVGVQVYERVMIRPVENLSPPGNQLVLRRVATPRDGVPGSKRYGFLGQQLPTAFTVPEGGRWAGGTFTPNPGELGSGLLIPLNPRTLERAARPGQLQALYFSTGSIGPLRGAALVGLYYG